MAAILYIVFIVLNNKSNVMRPVLRDHPWGGGYY